MSGLVGFSGTQNGRETRVTHQQSQYLQAIGQYEAPYGQALEYPNQEGSPQYSGYGSYGTRSGEAPYGQALEYPNQEGSPQYSGYGSFGQEPDMPPPPPDMPPPPPPPSGGPPVVINGNLQKGATTLGLIWTAASIAGTAGGAYHGYKRNKSIGWAIGWGLLGGLFPIIVLPLAAAQGFGKPKGGR
jgi:hypothetical protein